MLAIFQKIKDAVLAHHDQVNSLLSSLEARILELEAKALPIPAAAVAEILTEAMIERLKAVLGSDVVNSYIASKTPDYLVSLHDKLFPDQSK